MDRIGRLEVATTRQFAERANCLVNVRHLLFESSAYLRDALLEKSNSGWSAGENHAREVWRGAGQKLNRCWQETEKPAPARLLDQLVAGYWTQVAEILHHARNENQGARLELFHYRLVPLRERILESFDDIISWNRAEMLRQAEGRAAQLREERDAVWVVIFCAGILSFGVAMITYVQFTKLQESSDRLYDNAVRSSAELERLSERLFHVQEEERRKIAADLHDDVGQRIAGLMFEMNNTAGRHDIPRELRSEMEAMEERLRTLAKDIQTMSRGLHSAVLDKIGLEAAIRSECDALSRRGLAVTFRAAGVPRRLQQNIALAMYRVFQEAAQNALKHSQTDRLDVLLEAEAGEVVLHVRDSGRGFDAASPANSAGLGMISMRERLRIAGGSLSISSEPGKGAEVVARVPLASSGVRAASTGQA